MDSESNIFKMHKHHSKVLFIAAGIILAGIILFLLGKRLIRDYEQLTYTVNSSHERIEKLNCSLKKYKDGLRVINAVWDPEVNIVQLCIKNPREAEGWAWTKDLVFCVDGRFREDINLYGCRVWSVDYTMFWLENNTDFETVTVQHEKTGEILTITH